ncbi:Hybrid signal transduction histidine kinase J [Mycena venus]|uniref:histidine kinase n=1 Tax=Mycena venus TaxID=2733690 RepID=A0A8H7D2J7_9AGAR|nr:Hybrid signal transduction histidine kinase J [Mycena venus]
MWRDTRTGARTGWVCGRISGTQAALHASGLAQRAQLALYFSSLILTKKLPSLKMVLTPFVPPFTQVINTMVDNLGHFAMEVTHGKLSAQTHVEDVEGTWRELTNEMNTLTLTTPFFFAQVWSIAVVTTAVANGDLSKQIEVDVFSLLFGGEKGGGKGGTARGREAGVCPPPSTLRCPSFLVSATGEILDLKNTVNGMVLWLWTLAVEVTRVMLEVGNQGKLSGEATVPDVEGMWFELVTNVTIQAEGEINTLKDTINRMVDQLSAFASEVTHVVVEVRTAGKLGGQARVDGVQGTWKDLTDNVNKMASNLMGQMRSISLVTKAVANGDLSKRWRWTLSYIGARTLTRLCSAWRRISPTRSKAVAYGDLRKTIDVEASGEILDLKVTINEMTEQLENFLSEVTQVALEVSTEGRLGRQARVEGVQRTWLDLTDNVNKMASNLTNQVWSISLVTKAVAHSNLRKIEVDTSGEILDLKVTINKMVERLSNFSSEVTHVTLEVGTYRKLGGQAEVKGVQGTWKDLTDNVNCARSPLVTKAVTHGNLEKTIDVDISGEMLDFKVTIKEMVAHLGNFSCEATLVALEASTEGKLGCQAEVQRQCEFLSCLLSSTSLRQSHTENCARRSTSTTQGLNLILDVAPEIPDALIGDSLRLRQVITNLVRNAIKFTHVVLSIHFVSLDPDSVTLQFCVMDTGIGIAQDKLNLIFDTFCQADGSTTREYGGTGLGLSISKRLTSLMQTWVESELGKGSKFYFTIMLQINQQQLLDAMLLKLSPFTKWTILFVDTLQDASSVEERVSELSLVPVVIHNVSEVSDKRSACTSIPSSLIRYGKPMTHPYRSLRIYVAASRQ